MKLKLWHKYHELMVLSVFNNLISRSININKPRQSKEHRETKEKMKNAKKNIQTMVIFNNEWNTISSRDQVSVLSIFRLLNINVSSSIRSIIWNYYQTNLKLTSWSDCRWQSFGNLFLSFKKNMVVCPEKSQMCNWKIAEVRNQSTSARLNEISWINK